MKKIEGRKQYHVMLDMADLERLHKISENTGIQIAHLVRKFIKRGLAEMNVSSKEKEKHHDYGFVSKM